MKSKQRKEKQMLVLLEAFSRLMEKKRADGKSRTAANYASCASKVRVYLGEEAECFMLDDVTRQWVTEFVLWLRRQHSKKLQTADFYLRTFRAMCNRSLLLYNKEWEGGSDPFKGITIKGMGHSKRSLKLEELRSLLLPSVRHRLTEAQIEAYDTLRFIFFMRGMTFQDVYNLTWQMVCAGGYVQYVRSKTKVQIEVEVTPEVAVIMEHYHRDDSPFVFPFLRRDKRGGSSSHSSLSDLSETSALRRINRHALYIGELLQLSIPLTTYVMRHTWATMMLESGQSVEVISQCLGHSSIRTTQIYLSHISTGRVDTAANKMLDKIVRVQQGVDTPDIPITPDAERKATAGDRNIRCAKKQINKTGGDNIRIRKRKKEDLVSEWRSKPAGKEVLDDKNRKRNSLSLYKRETIELTPLLFRSFDGAKIHITTGITKYATRFFYIIYNFLSMSRI